MSSHAGRSQSVLRGNPRSTLLCKTRARVKHAAHTAPTQSVGLPESDGDDVSEGGSRRATCPKLPETLGSIRDIVVLEDLSERLVIVSSWDELMT
jgi:hypothetical protein